MNISDLMEKPISSSNVVRQETSINGTNGHYGSPNARCRILVIGCGSVGRCSLPLLRELLINDLTPKSITVLDCAIPPSATLEWLKKANIVFEQKCLEEDSYGDLLCNYLSAGDLLLDLGFNVSTEALVRWCHQNGVLFVNTTVDVWFLTAKGGDLFHTFPFDLFGWHEELLEIQAELRQKHGPSTPTAIVEHGANPGLVSHFVKQGLQDMADYALKNHLIVDGNRKQSVETALKTKDHARLAYLLGVKTIHISERDSQTTNMLRKRNQIVNTWCAPSLCEESIGCVQFSWGTHERKIPEGAFLQNYPTEKWPPQRICIPKKAMDVQIRSWVPSGPILGMPMAHPESFTIADYLAIRGDNPDQLVYQPSVYFVYLPCDSAVCSLHEWRLQGFPPLEDERIMCNDIVSGADELGVLLLGGHEIPAWWIGSVLDIHQARRLVPNQSATTLQVAIAAVSAIIYALRHRQEGVRFPEQLDTEEILGIAKPFLGNWISEPVGWPYDSSSTNGLSVQRKIAVGDQDENEDCPWQFESFLLN